jgi:aconitate decarboxylase
MSANEGVLLSGVSIVVLCKRYPCHLGMHWGIDAALRTRDEIRNTKGNISVNDIKEVRIMAPKSKYINRPVPNSEHDGRSKTFFAHPCL